MLFSNWFKVRHKRADESPKILQIKYHNNNGKVELVTLKKVKDSTLVNSKVPIRNFEIEGEETEIYVRILIVIKK